MNLFEEAKRNMEEISQEENFFEKAKKKKKQIVWGDYSFAGYG